VSVAPAAVDISNRLLLDKDIQLELGGAVQNLYNFKFVRADKQFYSLRRRYPQHPMAYFLLGLSTWWKMVPTNVNDTRYDKTFLADVDTAQAKAAILYKADNKNYEACFFLAAAYGFEARRHLGAAQLAARHHGQPQGPYLPGKEPRSQRPQPRVSLRRRPLQLLRRVGREGVPLAAAGAVFLSQRQPRTRPGPAAASQPKYLLHWPGGQVFFAQAGLARLAASNKDLPTARRYYRAVLEDGDDG